MQGNKTIVPFIFGKHSIRAVLVDGREPWFVGADVAAALGYVNPGQAVTDHCKSLKKFNSIELSKLGFAAPPSAGLVMIPERDVYRLIMRSKLPSAERFEVWVVDDVLPTIRKTGGYGVPAPAAPALDDPGVLRGLLLNYADKVIRLKAEVTVLEPKAQALDRIAQAPGAMCVMDAAKALQLRPGRFIRWALVPANEWLFRRADGRLAAHQRRINEGLAFHKIWPRGRYHNLMNGRPHPLITIDGLVALSLVDWRAVDWSAIL